jgi:adenosylcobinamide-phosphate synthase
MFATLAVAALLIETAVGYPDALYRRIGHPVGWIGRLITWCEQAWNREQFGAVRHRVAGIATLALVLTAGFAAGALLAGLASRWLPPVAALLATALVASALLAQRSLAEHVRAVADALDRQGLEPGRLAVSHIVGRDTQVLDRAGVCRAAIESLAENFSDGVVAPLLWLTIFGLPGAAAYKAVNTADSMIGHRNERYRDFGWASARLDDFVNLPASRLAALWIVMAAVLRRGCSAKGALIAVRRDARHHRSPNAGWPEAAMAGALGLRLAGPRVYSGCVVQDHWMGDGRAEATPADIRRALALYRTACAIQFAAYAALALWATGGFVA